MPKEKEPQVEVESTEPKRPEGIKFIRCFYRKGRGVVHLQTEASRKVKGTDGIDITFRKCESLVPESHLVLLKANRRYGIDYLTQEDFYKLSETDPAESEAFHEQMREWCRVRKLSPPTIRMRYTQASKE